MIKHIFALLLCIQPVFAEVDSVIGIDQRVQITSANKSAVYNKIGLILISQTYSCTGTLITPTIVLTAAHCVVDASKKQLHKASEFAFYPGMKKYVGSALGKFSVKRVVTFKKYLENESYQHDVAILELTKSPNVGTIQIRQSFNNVDIVNKKITITGYPGDKDQGTLWEASGIGARLQPFGNMVIHTLDTYGGESGAAIRVVENGVEKIIGVHTGGGEKVNSGVAFTPEILAGLKSWIK